MPLTQVQIGQVIQINGRKYVKISHDKYLAADAVNFFTCGVHSTLTVANTCTCDGGYYYNSSGAQTHSVDGGSCFYRYCSGSGITAGYTTNTTCSCDSTHYASNTGAKSVAYGGSCSYIDCITYNNTLDANGNRYGNGTSACAYYQKAAGGYALASTCKGTLSGGFCWDTLDSNTYAWANRNNGCDSGFTVPTKDQFNTYISRMGSGNQIYQAWGLYGYYWSSTENNSASAYRMEVFSGSATTSYNPKMYYHHVRCIK